MNIQEATKGLFEPTDFYNQVDSVAYFILTHHQKDDGVYYTALGSLPERVRAAIHISFMVNDCQGYRASVLRAAMDAYQTKGFIDTSMPVIDVMSIYS